MLSDIGTLVELLKLHNPSHQDSYQRDDSAINLVKIAQSKTIPENEQAKDFLSGS